MNVSEFELVHFHCWIPRDTAHRCWEFSEACNSDFLFHPNWLRLERTFFGVEPKDRATK
jgi:hypothetical protein